MTYKPGQARIGDPTPQTHPELFTRVEIEAEIRYLRRLNRAFGENTLRTLVIVRLTRMLAVRAAARAIEESGDVADVLAALAAFEAKEAQP